MDHDRSSSPLTDEQRVSLIAYLAEQCGLEEVRFTGGEPLLHPTLIDLIGAVRAAAPSLEIAMTTNGQRLAGMASSLRGAGLDRLNVSLDTLDAKRYRGLTGGDLPSVLAGIERAAAVGLTPVRINTVVLSGVNDGELGRLAAWAGGRGLELRFLEVMPIGPAAGFNRRHFVSAERIRQALARRYTVIDRGRESGSTARRYLLVDGAGPIEVGIIAPVSEPFCGDCRRMRLTADGRLFRCLLDPRSVDLAEHLRGSAPSSTISSALETALKAKARAGSQQPTPMIQLGG